MNEPPTWQTERQTANVNFVSDDRSEALVGVW